MTIMKTNQYEIWVEGTWDKVFIEKLLKKASFPLSDFEVKDRQGANRIIKTRELPARLAPDNGPLAIILDYDPLMFDEATGKTEHPDKWVSICTLLNSLGYKGPSEPVEAGSIFTKESYPPTGVWMMPDNQSRGILEVFLTDHVFVNDALMPRAKQVIQDIEAENLNRYLPKDKPKAIMQTWLAWQKLPGEWRKTEEEDMEIESELVQSFFTWIKRVFDIT